MTCDCADRRPRRCRYSWKSSTTPISSTVLSDAWPRFPPSRATCSNDWWPRGTSCVPRRRCCRSRGYAQLIADSSLIATGVRRWVAPQLSDGHAKAHQAAARLTHDSDAPLPIGCNSAGSVPALCASHRPPTLLCPSLRALPCSRPPPFGVRRRRLSMSFNPYGTVARRPGPVPDVETPKRRR